MESKPAAPDAAAPSLAGAKVPATLRDPGALGFWLAVVLTGLCAGLGAAASDAAVQSRAGARLGRGRAFGARSRRRGRPAPCAMSRCFSAAGLVTGLGQWR